MEVGDLLGFSVEKRGPTISAGIFHGMVASLEDGRSRHNGAQRRRHNHSQWFSLFPFHLQLLASCIVCNQVGSLLDFMDQHIS